MNCKKCRERDPRGESHYHIFIEEGEVIKIWFVSASGYWDREFEKDEYTVEYRCSNCRENYPASEISTRGKEQLCFACEANKYYSTDEDIPF
jgi:hypothetical protein